MTVDRQLVDPNRPELGWEWCALRLDPPGNPPGVVADGDWTTRASSTSGPRDAVLAGLVELPAGRCLVRAALVEGLDGYGWVPLPPLDQVRRLGP